MYKRVHFRVRPARILWIAVAAMLAASAAMAGRWRLIQAQADDAARKLAAGKILVARRGFPDPNFAETVILLVQYDEDGTMGLIINRQTKVPLSRLSRELQSAKGRTEPLYIGGPVETSGVTALVRSRTKPEDAKHVSDDVYLISGKATLEKNMASGSDSKTFRLYLGYAGWDVGQLEWEMGMDAWDVIPANTGLVFDPHPETLWTRLVGQQDLQMAGLPKDPFPSCQ
jgi:putative transcriptional regulator